MGTPSHVLVGGPGPWVLLASLLAMGSGCEVPPLATPGHGVDYTLTWRTGNADLVDGALQVVTDQGYTVVVNTAYVVTFSVKLVPCDDETDITLTDLVRWMFGGVAHAGHGGENRDPSAALVPRVEDLLSPDDVLHARRPIRAERYCQVHYLVGPAAENAIALPTDPDLVGTSLYLEGHWRRGDTADSVPFAVISSKAYGALTHLYPADQFDVSEARLRVDADDTSAHVTIERPLATLFDGVDWPAVSDAQLEAQLLRNLIGQTRTRVVLTREFW